MKLEHNKGICHRIFQAPIEEGCLLGVLVKTVAGRPMPPKSVNVQSLFDMSLGCHLTQFHNRVDLSNLQDLGSFFYVQRHGNIRLQ